MTINLVGKAFVVMGVANKRSIAWGIARSLDKAGARLIFTFAGERLEKNVQELASSLEGKDSIV
ncbi:MAG TPA: SDR family oxidoreductase, partial [Bacillus sp. (in: firmicutes)]|nr:SDR family oxidoreductase [Bacillus sp. (in: firmicutes)]